MGKGQRIRRAGLPLVIIAGTVLAAAILLAVRADPLVTDPDPMPVEIGIARLQDSFVEDRRYAGRVTPRRSVDLAFEVGGRLRWLGFAEGASVPAGAVLARLDDERLRLRLAGLEAEEAEIAARLQLARKTEQRNQELAREGFASAQRFDEARFSASALQASQRAIRVQQSIVRRDLADTELTAPFDAVIVAEMVDEGSVVSPGQPVLRLHETGAREARIGVPAADLARLAVGETVAILLPEGEAEARVSGIIPAIDPATRTALVVLTIDDRRAVPGALVRLTLPQPVGQPGFRLPVSALTEGPEGLWSVFVVVDEEGRQIVRRKDVALLHAGTDHVIVQGLLGDGDRVVVTGLHRLVPGMAVRVVEPVRTARRTP